MRQHSLVIILSLLAAFAYALSSSLKHVSAGHAPDVQSLHVSRFGAFVRATITHRLWLAGLACDVVGVALHIVALHRGALALVQPLLTSGLVFALVLRRFHDHHHIERRQVVWTVLLTCALAGFVLLTVSGIGIAHRADRVPATVSAAIGTVLAVGCIALGRRQQRRGRSAALMGVALGVIYAATAALLKSLTDIATTSAMNLFVSWQLYVVIVVGAIGFFLNQVAFQAGPITASLPAASTVDPLLSIAIGILVYDEHVRRGPGHGVVLIGLLVLLGVAAIQLARSHDA